MAILSASAPPVDAAAPWPIDLVYKVTTTQVAELDSPMMESTHRFQANSWDQWTDEVLTGPDAGYCRRYAGRRLLDNAPGLGGCGAVNHLVE